MSYLTDVTVAIGELDKWQRVALAAMCAASVLPVIDRFAQPATLKAFEQGLDAAWKSARSRATDRQTVPALTALGRLPESNCDDSNVPAHDVMEALSILAYALDAIIESDSERWVKYSCTSSAGCYSGYDYVLVFGNQTRKIDPRNPPPPGRLESLQIRSQIHLIEVMRNATELSDEVIEQVQASAALLASELDRALPVYAERRGWKVRPF